MKIRNTFLFLIGCLFALNSYAAPVTVTEIKINSPKNIVGTPHFLESAAIELRDRFDKKSVKIVLKQDKRPLILDQEILNQSVCIYPIVGVESHKSYLNMLLRIKFESKVIEKRINLESSNLKPLCDGTYTYKIVVDLPHDSNFETATSASSSSESQISTDESYDLNEDFPAQRFDAVTFLGMTDV